LFKFSILIFSFVLLLGCEPTPYNDKQSNSSVYHLLIFQKELKLEIWRIDDKNTFLDSFNLKNLPQLPIGQFDLNFDEKNENIEINFPNEFYKTKSYDLNSNLVLNKENVSEQFFKKIENAAISEIIIFPNDNRLTGDLIPCFACPHWMAEVYSFLNIIKKEYLK